MSILVLLIGLWGVFWSRSAQPQSYYGIDVPNAPVIFLLDVSGSMEQLDEGDRTASKARNQLIDGVQGQVGRALGGRVGSIVGNRLKRETSDLGRATQELTQTVLKVIPAGTPFTIITFGSSIQEWREGLVVANNTTKILAATHLQRLAAGGGTPMMAALRRAFSYRDVQTIFLVTDGAPTDASAIGIIREVERMNEGRYVTLNTIGIGADQNADLLCQLAEGNGGVYVSARRVQCKFEAPPPSPQQIDRGSIRFSRRVAADLDANNVMEIRTRDPYLGIHLRTLAVLGPDGLRYSVQALPLDEHGRIVPIITTGSREAGGHFYRSTSHTFKTQPNPHGTLWRVYIPPQQAVRDDADGVDVYVEYNPLP